MSSSLAELDALQRELEAELTLERRVFAWHDGDANPFDDAPGPLRERVLSRRRGRHCARLFYGLYLRSQPWHETRARILERAHYRCETCGAGGLFGAALLDVHHLIYDHVGHEFDYELVALCRPCHEQVHA